jgi:hypothetical protein
MSTLIIEKRLTISISLGYLISRMMNRSDSRSVDGKKNRLIVCCLYTISLWESSKFPVYYRVMGLE